MIKLRNLFCFILTIVCFWYRISDTRNRATGTRNWYQKTGTSFWYVCHAIWYQFLFGTRFWYQMEHVLFRARFWYQFLVPESGTRFWYQFSVTRVPVFCYQFLVSMSWALDGVTRGGPHPQ